MPRSTLEYMRTPMDREKAKVFVVTEPPRNMHKLVTVVCGGSRGGVLAHLYLTPERALRLARDLETAAHERLSE